MMRLCKPHTIALAKRCILEALGDGAETVKEILESYQLLNEFHGVRTLNQRQIWRLCKQLLADGKIKRGPVRGAGMRTCDTYRLASTTVPSMAQKEKGNHES
jgi:enterochelin esterase-like enzyme